MSDQTTIHTLRQCVAAWVKVWSNLQTASRPFAMEKLFHKPAEMLDCVLLTAVVCYAHLQVHVLDYSVANVLIIIGDRNDGVEGVARSDERREN